MNTEDKQQFDPSTATGEYLDKWAFKLAGIVRRYYESEEEFRKRMFMEIKLQQKMRDYPRL